MISMAACSKQKAPETPTPESSALADAGAAASSAASTPASDAPGVETLFVRGALADCQGETPRKCLVVRGAPGEPWRNLYASIDGFQHDPAFDYELRVEVTTLAGAPADAPSLRYRLLEIVSKQPAAAP